MNAARRQPSKRPQARRSAPWLLVAAGSAIAASCGYELVLLDPALGGVGNAGGGHSGGGGRDGSGATGAGSGTGGSGATGAGSEPAPRRR
ncbi:MAG: hypothetical protein HY744_31315 [Deltaproteobacteria bacterium]|nr:hypothetical protein [Deltaproteobacteria bacterium]